MVGERFTVDGCGDGGHQAVVVPTWLRGRAVVAHRPAPWPAGPGRVLGHGWSLAASQLDARKHS